MLSWCLVTLTFLAVLEAEPAPGLSLAKPSACMPAADDYTLMYWADGFRGRTADGRWLRVIQSAQYAMALDVTTMTVPHLGILPGGSSYRDAAASNDPIWKDLPPASLQLTLLIDGRQYRCVAGGKQELHTGPRLIESGRYVQRADVTDLDFRDSAGSRLPVDARLETIAWPDRLGFVLDAVPGREPLAPGPCFGRVGGGFYLDGSNHLELPYASECDPEKLTVELWVYLADGPSASCPQPWLVCADGNEWSAGNYGIMFTGGVPTAMLNIGGGPGNMHMASAAKPHRSGSQGPLSCHQWHHLAMTYDGNSLEMYVDGLLTGRENIGKKRTAGRHGLAIGRRQDNSGDGYHFRGVIDEVRLWRRALTPDEIAAHAAAPEKVVTDGALAHQWLFDLKGPALPQWPSSSWREGSMEIRLESCGQVFSDRAPIAPGAPWTQREHKVAAISLATPPKAAPPPLQTTPASTAAHAQKLTEARGLIAASPTACHVSARAIPTGQACTVGYDLAGDWYEVDLDNVQPQGDGNDAMERVKLSLENPGATPVLARLMFRKNGPGFRIHGIQSITGMSPMLRDLDGYPLGIPVQISKNWHRLEDRQLVHQGPWFHGFSLLRLPPKSQTALEFTLVYAHWGGVAAVSHAQLCLVGWGSNQLWDQSAMGAWGESICYEPDQAQARCGVLDVRPLMVHALDQAVPTRWNWTNNVGGADFFRYFDSSGKRIFPARMKTAYRRYGPNLTEVTYAGSSQDGKFDHRETVSLIRSDDLIRGIYRIRMDVRQPLDFSRFVLFQVGADTYNTTSERSFALGNENGLLRQWTTRWGGNAYRTDPLPCDGAIPWISLHHAVSRDRSKSGAWANRGIVIRHWQARLGGKDAKPWVAEHGVHDGGPDTSTADILPPPDVKKLLPGDYVDAVFEHVIMPQFARDYYGPNRNLQDALKKHEDSWQMIHREAVANNLNVRSIQGTLEQAWPVRIRAAREPWTVLQLSGGVGYCPVTITGLPGYRVPTLETRQPGGAWTAVDQSRHGNDFWQTDHDPATGTWQLTYNVPLDTPGDTRTTRELRFRLSTDRALP